LNGYLKDLRSVSLKTCGDMGPEALQWVWGLGRIPQDIALRAPAAISSAHLIWKKDPSEIVLSAGLSAENGPQVALEMQVLPEMVQIKDLRIQDEKSDAALDLTLNKEELSFAFAGNLEKATMDKLLVKNRYLGGWVKGDFKALLRKKEPTRAIVQGELSAAHIGCPCISKGPVEIEGLSLKGTKRGVRLESAVFEWGDSRMSLQGDLRFSAGIFLMDMALSADRLGWREVEEIISAKRAKKREARPPVFWTVPLQGSLRIEVGRFDYHGLAWDPLKAHLSLGSKEVTAVVTEADLCGISTPANIGVFPEEVTLDMSGSAKDEKLDEALTCLGERERLITGDFTLEAKLTARGKAEDLVDSLGGHGDFLSTKGRIYRFPLLAGIFALLNVSEIFRGRLPDLAEGFGYRTLKIKAKVLKGTLSIEEATLDGSTMNIVCEGNMDLVSRKIDFTILVAPFKTIDSLIQHLPLLGYIFQGRLVSVPVKVTGDWSHPVVTPLAPSAVGSELLGLMERTFLSPYQIIQPLIQGKSKP
ncbi:MAG: AsmA-like C-terminal domain-containing protein, partial [Deltaproteobacteria bacterium]